jgi:cell division septum initiation protein DivIVA
MSADGVSRLSKVENDLAQALAAVQQLLEENQELRTQIAGLVEHKMQEQGWLVSSGSAEALYLR